MLHKTKAKYKIPYALQFLLISLLIPTICVLYTFLFTSWQQLRTMPPLEKHITYETKERVIVERSFGFDVEIPPTHIATYEQAAAVYDIPWTLLAAVHRVETNFSTAQTDRSTAGAEGPFQFMPCTFVGWAHPTCSGKGQGAITAAEKTDVSLIRQYGGYGIDGDGDGVANPFHFVDAVYSAAHYLAASGAKDAQYEKAIYTYNHSSRYVEDVSRYFVLYEQHREQLEQHAAQY